MGDRMDRPSITRVEYHGLSAVEQRRRIIAGFLQREGKASAHEASARDVGAPGGQYRQSGASHGCCLTAHEMDGMAQLESQHIMRLGREMRIEPRRGPPHFA